MTTALEVVDGLDLRGRTALVTGATAGLGRASARALAAAGATVLLAGRARLDQVRHEILASVPHADLEAVELDLASLASVRRAAAVVSRRHRRLDVLMNNAGVMFTPLGRTADGFETQLGINHLGHFELTRLLEPLLAPGSRVVIMSSGGWRLGEVDLDDPSWERRDYDKFGAYGASKSANLHHLVSLAARLPQISCFGVNPGAVATDLARHMSRQDFSALRQHSARSAAARGETTDGRLSFQLPDAGAASQVWAAVAPELEGRTNLYLEDCAVSEDRGPRVLDPDVAERVWELSEKLCAT